MYLEKCCNCGRFIGYDNYVVSTPYGGPTDLDPPDEEYECLKCWDDQEEEWRELTYRISYTKPIVVRDGKKTGYVPKEMK